MYYYYGMRELTGYAPWWKKYLTLGQIAQFWLDLGFVVANLSKLDSCPGDPWVMIASLLFTLSLLVLFANFYVGEYLRKLA